jgi:membrane protease YdiL (CAAX protease family)
MKSQAPRSVLKPATLLGLFLALVVPTLPPVIDSVFFGTAETSARVVWGTVVHWANFAALIAVVLLVEHQRLTSIGLRPLTWWTIPLGLVAGLLIIPISGFLASAVGASADAHFTAFLLSLPFATRLILVVTAGVFEETLYRGYALERLASLFGNKWLAGAVTVAFFTLAHLPAMGLAHLLPVFIVSVLITLLYLWRRDLVVNVIAHATIDGVALLLVPLLGHHG